MGRGGPGKSASPRRAPPTSTAVIDAAPESAARRATAQIAATRTSAYARQSSSLRPVIDTLPSIRSIASSPSPPPAPPPPPASSEAPDPKRATNSKTAKAAARFLRRGPIATHTRRRAGVGARKRPRFPELPESYTSRRRRSRAAASCVLHRAPRCFAEIRRDLSFPGFHWNQNGPRPGQGPGGGAALGAALVNKPVRDWRTSHGPQSGLKQMNSRRTHVRTCGVPRSSPAGHRSESSFHREQ